MPSDNAMTVEEAHRKRMADFGQFMFDAIEALTDPIREEGPLVDSKLSDVTDAYITAWLKIKRENRELQARIAALEAQLAGEPVPESDDSDAQWLWSVAHNVSRVGIHTLKTQRDVEALLRIYRKLTPPPQPQKALPSLVSWAGACKPTPQPTETGED